MYKILLCLRYLRTRYIALACIISVTLGVATMIVVNSVMAGFSHEMRDRIHGLLADVIVETSSLDGVPDADAQMARIRAVAGEHIAGMTATVEVYGMLTFEHMGQFITRTVTVIGIRPEEKAEVGPLKDYLDSYREIREDGKLVRAAFRPKTEAPGWELTPEAMAHRKKWVADQQWMLQQFRHGHTSQATAPLNVDRHDNAAPTRTAEVTPVAPPFATAPPFSPEAPPFATETTPPVAPGPAVAAKADDPVTLPPQQPLAQGNQPPVREAFNANNPFENLPPELAGPSSAPVEIDPAAPLDCRLYVGIGLISFPRDDDGDGEAETVMMVRPGDDVKLSTVSAGRPPEARHFNATVVDVVRTGMSEYDSNLVFCNLEYLQTIRGMISIPKSSALTPGQTVAFVDGGRKYTGRVHRLNNAAGSVEVTLDPAQARSGIVTVNRFAVEPQMRSITSIQIRLTDFDHADEVVERLRAEFPPGLFSVRTWEQKQGPLLAAVEVESAILNVLLFLIIAVAGFGILAIFFMIVVEKTRDIGILKALGASSSGVMSIFLSYGLALGIVGSGAGVIMGLLFVKNINIIEGWITWITGRKVFDEKIYYFPEIPTSINPYMVMWVAVGAMAIAVMSSVLPARRASRLHPVEALRYE